MLEYPSKQTVIVAVKAYNQRYGREDEALWHQVHVARDAVISRNQDALGSFVWRIKVWGRIQGVRHTDRPAMVRALLSLDMDLDSEEDVFSKEEAETVAKRLADLVTASRAEGVKARHFSWSSKILHWLQPRRFPIYDRLVRVHLACDGKDPSESYRRIVSWQFEAARRLLQDRDAIVGDVHPRTLLRALDKYLWWVAGGAESKGAVFNTI